MLVKFNCVQKQQLVRASHITVFPCYAFTDPVRSYIAYVCVYVYIYIYYVRIFFLCPSKFRLSESALRAVLFLTNTLGAEGT